MTKQQQQQFLRKVARLETKGLQMKDIAKQVGCSPGTLTYRLSRLGYQTQIRIVNAQTGEPLSDLVTA